MFDSLPDNSLVPPNPPAGGVGGPVSPSLGGPASTGQSSLGGPAPIKIPQNDPDEFISVMPIRFRSGKNKKTQASIHPDITNPEAIAIPPKKKKTTLIIVIIAVAVLIVGSAGFYLWAKNYLKSPKSPVVDQPTNNQPVTQETPELKLSADLKDASQQELSNATLDFPAGSLSKDQAPLTLTATSTPDAMTITDKTYQYLGGVYKIGPSIPTITSASLVITYTSTLIQDGSWESDIKIAYLQAGSWIVISNAQLDINNNAISATFDTTIPADTFALVVDQSKMQAPGTEVQIAPKIFSSADQENNGLGDGLTDIEEKIYQTDPTKPDTDGDGQPDGLEVANLGDPLHADGTLILSGLIKVYTNDSWSYSFFYPSGWTVSPLPETESRQVLVVTNTTEYFEVLVSDNPAQLTSREWYLKISPQVDSTQVTDTVVVGQSAVWDPNHLNVYVADKGRTYTLSYSLGTEQEASFKTTFKMFIKSFQFLSNQQAGEENMPAGAYRGNRPDGTVIKYEASPAVYIIQSGLKNAIPSEAVLTELGHTFNDVVTIPDQEWYPDGPMAQ